MIIDDEDVMNGKWFMCQGQKKGKSLVVTVEGFEVKKKTRGGVHVLGCGRNDQMKDLCTDAYVLTSYIINDPLNRQQALLHTKNITAVKNYFNKFIMGPNHGHVLPPTKTHNR